MVLCVRRSLATFTDSRITALIAYSANSVENELKESKIELLQESEL